MVITIIVLLILAGITISAITGNESILEKAKEAKVKTEEVTEREQIDLKKVNSKLEPEWDGTVANNFAGGTGSSIDPYLVENGAQLAYLASLVNNGDNFTGKHVSITKSINLGNKKFTPIGIGNNLSQSDEYRWDNSHKFFNGILEGNNNVITGINIEQKGYDEVGLIGILGENGTIKNLNLYEGKIIGKERVGSIVGASQGNIEKCTNNLTIIVCGDGTATGGENAGGIAGYAISGNITNCINYGKIYYDNEMNSIYGGYDVGGIVGTVFIMDDSKQMNIKGCKNYGEITAYAQAGGIVGYTRNVTNVEDCVNNGIIITDHTYAAGGIIGWSRKFNKIVNCINNGSVTAHTQSAGGIVGLISLALGEINFDGTITNCYNTGSIEAESTGVRGIAGGIVGNVKAGTISDVYNSGNVTVQHLDTNTNISVAGGIVGLQTAGRIEKAYNKGNILGEGEVKGGIVGQQQGGTIIKTYFYSLINNSSINGVGTTTSDKEISTPLSPVSTDSGKVESTDRDFNSLNEFLSKISSL